VTVARGLLDRAVGALRPALLEQRLARARDRIQGVERLLVSVHPERPLQRGYAWVSARPGGAVVGSAGAARAAGAVTLHFRDGRVDAKVERAAGPAYEKSKGERPEQPSLL